MPTAVMPNMFRPTAGFFGTQLVSSSVAIGTGATAVANTATTPVILPKPSCTSCQLVALSFSALIAAASAGGTVTLQAFKRDNSGTPADRTLTATRSIEADVVTVLSTTYQIPITATSIANLTFGLSDICRIDAVASSSLETAPVVTVTGLWAIVTP